ncbi:regulator of G-protein signaling 22 isoform X23 [Pongo pygmaeus]|uniref:regulator of G-protein signaling 22 isoform X23 n=1 Tax=Pongo pygmaeus TaxID=9600 RepID=UPI0023E18993|nr:regulator of G-protein signaling 22 isoform X17 [Pongo pygmaeus]
MPEKRLTAEPPTITEEEFEDSLATDDFLVDYFNEFLSLPTFSEAIRFNADYGVFEVVNDAPQLLEKQLKKILQNQQPRNPIYDVIRKGKNEVKPVQMNAPDEDETINVNYNIMCLSREEGIKWIKKERLPAFLESDCYFEYRLAKLVSQVRWSKSGMNFTVGSNFSPWIVKKPPSLPPPATEEDNLASYTQTKDWFALAKQSQQTVSTFSLPCCVPYNKLKSPAISSVSENFIFDDGVHPRTKKDPSKTNKLISEFEEEEGEEEEVSVSLQDTPSQALLRVYLGKKQDVDESLTMHFSTCEEFLSSYIYFILRGAIQQIVGKPVGETPDYINFNNITKVSFDDCFESIHGKNFLSELVQTTKERSEEIEQTSLSSKSESAGPESRADWCVSHRTYDIGNRKEFERFKKFIKGTLGERYWWLWMDIERLKVLKDPGRHQRHLEKMKKCYLVSNGDYYLSAEILSKFKLLDGSQWNEEHLRNIQSEVLKPLLLYWAPRFCVTHSASTKYASAELKFWHLRQAKPRKDIDPFPQMATLLPLRPKSCIPQIPEIQKEEFSLSQPPKSPNKSPEVKTATQKPWKRALLYPGSSKDDVIEKGSKRMSESSKVIHLTSFTDISECLKPQLDRRYAYTEEPKYLFATYVAPSATLDIGLQQEKKKEIYMKIQPPFEDLFDTAEEYILLLLLEPWTKMVKSDKIAYKKVELVEETRQLDSTYFRKLQALHKETFSKKAEDTTCEIGTGILSLSNVSKRTEYWDNVPAEYKHFKFSDLLNNKLEFEHFRQFLETHSSSMDLMCWTDIEQFRRITYRDRNQRKAKSIYIKNKYLNKKYFFGPNSPASLYQQNQLQMKDIAEELLLQKPEKKIGVWKPVESKWISSSCKIIAFRKALLNPVTSRQFQRFVALKGDLLENGLLFWQEVQKYKDLCHSHCDESVIQKKITTIINCFINSSIPPALQIDIPVEQAQKIIEHRKELGPYVFREAQMTIFGVLFKFWPQFCEFRKNLTDENIMSVLERRQEYNKQKKKLAVLEDEKSGKDGIKQYANTSVPAIKTALLSDSFLGLQPYGRQPTWCYSKYIEALEQERILLKIQEELEKKLFAGLQPLTNFKASASTMSLKKNMSAHSSQK